ncbi:sugar isomerase [Neobacillus cucumis]|uniref:lipopolysaccharide biosynthesis protein n=1 Tax=Neobacillus cucumis TaxID=1740721 RepID=UPI0018E00467|nr:sugar isomerase [Neobacillus cucumis]MBI0577953.1 sugar isomerase [Neobacillus cucumis]
MKSKIAFFNILTDALSKVVLLGLGILLPKLYIQNFGSEINGLLSSLSGIFVYLALLEAGVGGASIQALYSPISKKNHAKINGILAATNKFYKKTGLYFLGCVSILAFLYPYFIKSELKFSLIVTLVLLSAVPTALRFFYQGRYIVLLNADNKIYILNLFSTVFNIISNIAKIILIITGKNIIYVQIVFSIINVVQVILINLYVKRKYSYLDFKSKADEMAISKKNSVMVHEIASTLFNNIDVLLLTFFCGLKVVSVYTIYNMIFIQTGFIVKTVSVGLTASFGQLYFEDNNKFTRLFNCFEIYYQAMVFSVFVTAGLLATPFITLYTKGVSDIQYVDKYLPILFMIVNILSNVRWPSVIAINIAGHFKETQWRALLETTLNLVFSMIFVKIYGIYGVLFGTIIALLYRTIDMVIYSNQYILKKSIIMQFRRILLFVISGISLSIIFKYLNLSTHNYFDFSLAAGFVFLINSLTYLIIASLMDKQSLRILLKFVTTIIRKFNQRLLSKANL